MILRLFLAALLIIGTLGAVGNARGEEGITYKQESDLVGYCHMKLPAIREQTLAGDHPVVTEPSKGDIIDFYGPCGEDPQGYHQIETQRLGELHRSPVDCC